MIFNPYSLRVMLKSKVDAYVFSCTGGPRYMRSFYLRFRVYAIQKWHFFWNLSSNYQSSLVFLDSNSLYSSLFLESLSLEYNEVQLYCFFEIILTVEICICIISLYALICAKKVCFWEKCKFAKIFFVVTIIS